MRRVIAIIGLLGLLASASYGQEVLPSGHDLGVFDPSLVLVSLLPLPLTQTPCNLEPTPVDSSDVPFVDPSGIEWDDPYNAGRVCRIDAKQLLDHVPNALAYLVGIRSVAVHEDTVSEWVYAPTLFGWTQFTPEPAPPPPPPPIEIIVCPSGMHTRSDFQNGVYRSWCEDDPPPDPTPQPTLCVFSIDKSSEVVPAAGATFTVHATPNAPGCPTVSVSAIPGVPPFDWASWQVLGELVTFTVVPNTSGAQRYTAVSVGGQSVTILQGAGAIVVPVPVPVPVPPPPPPPTYTGSYEVVVVQSNDVATDMQSMLSSFYAQDWRVVASVYGLLILEREHK